VKVGFRKSFAKDLKKRAQDKKLISKIWEVIKKVSLWDNI